MARTHFPAAVKAAGEQLIGHCHLDKVDLQAARRHRPSHQHGTKVAALLGHLDRRDVATHRGVGHPRGRGCRVAWDTCMLHRHAQHRFACIITPIGRDTRVGHVGVLAPTWRSCSAHGDPRASSRAIITLSLRGGRLALELDQRARDADRAADRAALVQRVAAVNAGEGALRYLTAQCPCFSWL